ncbi:MAG: TonB-dependent receptor [Pacificimonas sp.]
MTNSTLTSVLRLTTALTMAAAVPAFAQESIDTADTGAQADEDIIIVTGTRLARDLNEAAPSPVSTVNLEDIRSTGVVDVSEALREIPALSNSGTIADSLERGAGGIGQATLNLRGLGSERTLVVVNGKRHVSGVAGSQIVDVSSIPSLLIERVEVLTGGASSVYGADAVTGVVNYILKEDFEGAELNGQVGLSEEGDGFTGSIEAVVGTNFADNRGNIAFSAGYNRINELQQGDRAYAANNRIANAGLTYGNPAKRFQQGDITAANTPNFFNFFNVDNGLYPYGFAIPLPDSDNYESIFGDGTTPTAAEQALIDASIAAPANSFEAFPVFAISSNEGLVFRRDFGFFNADINNNGVQDCEESYIGFTGFGGGGCYVTTADGGVRIFQDGIVATSTNQFGGDGAPESNSAESLIPRNERINFNLLGSFEFSEGATAYFDAKYVNSETRSQNPYNTFYDSLLIREDNPFIPDVLADDADEAGGLRVSRDFTDLGPGFTTAKRETYRLVAGLRGAITDHLDYDFSANYGRFESDVTSSNTVLYDRLFAALDAVDEGEFTTGVANGNVVCRSDLDGGDNPYPGSQFFPVIAPGFFTFNPGDGSCAPISLFGGTNSVSQAGVDFITVPTTNKFTLEQLVFSAALVGDTGAFLTLPGGPVQFALGTEFREEISKSRFNDFSRGILQIDTPDGNAGDFIGDISDNNSLDFDASTRTFNSGGSFDVFDFFGEVRLPILSDRPFFDELELSAAARYSTYSTVGGTFTWNVSGIYAPIPDIKFRGTYAQAVRAPNVSELFDPQQGTVFRPIDPCDQNQIDTLAGSDDPDIRATAANRTANCDAERAAILGAEALDNDYTDPLTARFPGTTGGNPNLEEETAKSYTVGAVIQPRFVPGLTITADYYNIRIDDAISAVSSQDIVDGCYDNSEFPNQFCGQFDRSDDNFGLTFLRQTQLNFGRIESAGIDAAITYGFDLGNNQISLAARGTWVDKLNFFFDPTDFDNVDPELREQGRPEWNANGSVNWQNGPFSLGYRLQYLGQQAIRGVEIETIDEIAGERGFAGETFIHDASFSVDIGERYRIYGGVNNFTDEKPNRNSSAYPVTPYGRAYFLGINMKTDGLF